MTGKRLIVTLPEEDRKWLDGYSHAHCIPVAEAVRRGIRKLKDDDDAGTYGNLLEKTGGLWEKGDGLNYQENIRSEWEQR